MKRKDRAPRAGRGDSPTRRRRRRMRKRTADLMESRAGRTDRKLKRAFSGVVGS